MTKSADAFRTISEVADWLGVQPHVLRFWESKFTQVKPVKRAGGRRYYRPNDMLLLGGIRKLLHEDGLTIKGVQKIMREEGMAHVADLSPSLEEDLGPVEFEAPPAPQAREPDPAQPDMFGSDTPELPSSQEEPPADLSAATPQDSDCDPDEAPMAEDVPSDPATVTELPSFVHRAAPAPDPVGPPDAAPPDAATPDAATADTTAEAPTSVEADLPSFLHSDDETKPDVESSQAAEVSDAKEEITPACEDPEPTAPTEPVPHIVDAPDPDESSLTAVPGALSAAIRITRLTEAQRQSVIPLAARLAAHRDHLTSGDAQTERL